MDYLEVGISAWMPGWPVVWIYPACIYFHIVKSQNTEIRDVPQSQKLETVLRDETQYRKPGFLNGVWKFCRYKYFDKKYYFLWFLQIFCFVFLFFKSKSTQMYTPQKGNSGVSFNDPFFNFRLREPIILCYCNTWWI